MSLIHEQEAAAAASRTRERLVQAMAAAYHESYGVPVEHVVLQELRRIGPDGTITVSFFMQHGDDAERALLDADMALAAHFKGLGWEWTAEGATQRPAAPLALVPEPEGSGVEPGGHDANGTPIQ
jgi:hypothetical protein